MLIAKPPPKRSTQNSGTLGKDTINKWIISFLSVGKRGFKSNFDLASIFLLIPPAGASLQLVPIHNSKFPLPPALSPIHPITPITPIAPIIAGVAHTPAGASLQLVPNSKFKIQNSNSPRTI